MKYRKDNPETADTVNRNRVEKMRNGSGIKGMEEIVTLLNTLFCIFLSFGTMPLFHVCKKNYKVGEKSENKNRLKQKQMNSTGFQKNYVITCGLVWGQSNKTCEHSEHSICTVWPKGRRPRDHLRNTQFIGFPFSCRAIG